jgi:hypothetical protein
VPVLTEWTNFYVIVGSSAAALTGLMFVVITLAAGRRTQTTTDGITTFSTPTVAFFCVALFVGAILTAPWRSLVEPGILLALAGLYGIIYASRTIHRAKRMTTYRADLEDWIWYSVLPLFAHLAILVAAVVLPLAATRALFALAGATLLLIFIGIHNAWDVVTYIAIIDPQLPGDDTGTNGGDRS